jgi:tetratricopeptide (TPR) repeat protein
LSTRSTAYGASTIFFYRSNAYYYLSKIKEALSDIEEVLTIDPHNCDALINRGNIHYYLGHSDMAIADYTSVLAHNPVSTDYRSNQRLAIALTNTATILSEKGDYNAASRALDTAAQIDANLWQLRCNRAALLYDQKLYNDAVLECSSLISDMISEPIILYNRAIALYKLGSGRDSLKDLNAALEIDPNYAPALLLRGVIHAENGNHDLAIRDFSTYTACSETPEQGYFNRGLSYRTTDDLESAIADFAKALDQKPDWFEAMLNICDCYRLSGRINEAAAILSRAVEQYPDRYEGFLYRAFVYAHSSRYDEAIADLNHMILLKDDLEKALFLNPKYDEAFLVRGILFLKMGDHTFAQADFERAIALATKPEIKERAKQLLTSLQIK